MALEMVSVNQFLTFSYSYTCLNRHNIEVLEEFVVLFDIFSVFGVSSNACMRL